MKLISFLVIIVLLGLTPIVAQVTSSKFDVKIMLGPSFLSYGDHWGFDRGLSLQYGNKWFTRFEYNFSNYETSFFNQEFYKVTEKVTTQTKYLDNFFGQGIPAEYEFGYRLLDVKDVINTVNSYQLAFGRKIDLVQNLLSVTVRGNLGIYELTRISPSVIIRPVTISNPNYYEEDVVLIGTFTNSFLDYSWGFGTEFSYEILKDRLSFDIFTKATLGDVRFFSFGLGSSVKI